MLSQFLPHKKNHYLELMSHNSKMFSYIWIYRTFKKGASNNTISYFGQSFRFSGLWHILARDLGRSGQNKAWEQRAEREQIILFVKFWTVRCVFTNFSLIHNWVFVIFLICKKNIKWGKITAIYEVSDTKKRRLEFWKKSSIVPDFWHTP